MYSSPVTELERETQRRFSCLKTRLCGVTLVLALYSTSIIALQENVRVTSFADRNGSFRTQHLRYFSADNTRNSRVLGFYSPLLRIWRILGAHVEILSCAELEERPYVAGVVYLYGFPPDTARLLAETAPTSIDQFCD